MATFGHPGLPEDLVFDEILTKLPVKSLMRFKCVSKSWSLLISRDSLFREAHHLNIQADSDDQLLLAIGEGMVRRRLTLLSGRCSKATEIDVSYFVAGIGSIDIIGSCNGLLCLRKHYPSMCKPAQLLLWNPATRQLRRLPPSLSEAKCEEWSGAVGLGFGLDATSKDYKVVMLTYDQPQPSLTGNYLLRAQVFAKSGTVWRSSEVTGIAGSPHGKYAVTVDGVLHWMLHKTGLPPCVISFDLRDEVLRSGDAPGGESGVGVRLCRWTGLLAAFTSAPNGDCLLWTRTGMLWSPTVKFKVEIDGIFQGVWKQHVLVMKDNTAEGSMLSVKDPKTQHVMRNIKQPRFSNTAMLQVSDYIETMLSVF